MYQIVKFGIDPWEQLPIMESDGCNKSSSPLQGGADVAQSATAKREYKPVTKPTSESDFLSVEAAAELLGLSRNTVYEMVRTYQLPSKRVGPKRRVIRISRDSLLSYMEEIDKPWIGSKKKGGVPHAS
jgi:excisionase family DNA binding protein